jgi:glycosyltransferase involved in cell wall biosynthesis
VYNWFDPPTLIRAVDILRRTQENVRLYFLGMRHPNPEVPAMRMAAETVALAKDLSLVGSHVFFNEDWVPYEERGDYLLEADIGVSTHLEHVETAYSYRTRVLDYFWAGLPVVVTRGDALGALVERRGLGRTVPPEDPQGLADVLGSMLADQEVLAECRRNIEHVRPELTWDRALAPLASFCEQPGRAPDLPADRKEIRLEGDLPETVRIVGRALYYARVGGWPTVRRHAANYLKGGRRRRR